MSPTSASGGYLAPLPGLSRREIEDVLHSLIAGLTGIDNSLIRPRWQPVPPAQPRNEINWCAFGVTRRDMPNYPQLLHEGSGDGHGRLLVHEDLHCLASFYGPDAEEKALALRDGLHIGQNREPLYHAGLAFVEAGSPAFVPDFKDMGWRARCDLPLVFRRGPRPDSRLGPGEGRVEVLNITAITPCTGDCMCDAAQEARPGLSRPEGDGC